MDKINQLIYKVIHPFVVFYWKIIKPKTYGSRAIILSENSILLAKNINSKHWSLPGGKIEKDESPEQCLIRELKEELDIDVSSSEYKLGEYIANKEGKLDTVHIFIIRLKSSYFKKQWELADAKWFALSELPEDISPAGLRRIREFQNGAKNLYSEW